ncbi:MAG: PHP domain-containing protein [Velocimicrobium sp.]
MNNSIDLHMHSRYSDDGEFTPTELVEKCIASGISTMSITDHNTVRANEEAQKEAKKRGLCYISGIEIDCVFQNTNFHVLGYGIDYKSSDFAEIEKNIDDQSFDASLKMLAEAQELGFHITENDMCEVSKNNFWKGRWTGEMFAEVLLNNPEHNNHPLLNPYRFGGAKSNNPYVNFYWDYYSQGKPCYVKMEYPRLEDVINIIHQNGGKAVLAHPKLNLKNHFDQLHSLISAGIDGIEAFSSYHTPSQSFHFFREAQETKVFVTCGSDFHGKTKPAISLGQHGGIIMENELLSCLKKHLDFDK